MDENSFIWMKKIPNNEKKILGKSKTNEKKLNTWQV
jgi:hypothetical protein